MTPAQKGVKAFAITLAVIIIVAILSVIVGGLSFLVDISTDNDIDFNSSETSTNKDRPTEDFKLQNIRSIEVDLNTTSLEILKGDELKIDTSNIKDLEDIDINTFDKTVEITEADKIWHKHNTNGKIVIYIPEDTKLNNLDIDLGAGKLTIKDIETKNLELTQGAGVVTIDNIKSDSTNIEGGAGKLEIENSTLKDLELETGVGNTTINASILGNSDISCGVGSLILNLIGPKEDYTIVTEEGIGSIKIEDSTDKMIGSGPNKIIIEGGIGSVTVNFNR